MIFFPELYNINNSKDKEYTVVINEILEINLAFISASKILFFFVEYLMRIAALTFDNFFKSTKLQVNLYAVYKNPFKCNEYPPSEKTFS